MLKIHVVQKDETLWTIAQKYGVSLDELIAINTQLSTPNYILPGMKIKIPNTTNKKQSTSPPGTDKTDYKEKEKMTQPIMPSIQEDEQMNGAPLEKEMPSLPMQFHQQSQPQLPIQSLPNMTQGGQWCPEFTDEGLSHQPDKMEEHHHKGEYHHMNQHPMHPMPQQGGFEHQHPMPYPQGYPNEQQMQGHQGMAPPPPIPYHQQGGMPNNPYNMPPPNMEHAAFPGHQQVMPQPYPYGMHPAMMPAMPNPHQPQTLPAQHMPPHYGPQGDCGCGGPREE